MAFIDNPIIASLGAQLGLSGVFNNARTSSGSGVIPGYGDAGVGGVTPGPISPQTTNPQPPQMADNQPPPKPGASKPNVPEYKNRPYIPRNEATGAGATKSSAGAQPVTPGVMDYNTLQSPEVQKLLGQYGVHPTDTPPDPNLFIHNPEAFVKHPVLAGLLEHGLRGLAYTHPGGDFLQSLAGGVRGIQESNAASAQQQNSQMTAPFQQAGLVAGLQHQSDEHDSSVALQNYHQAMAAANGENAETRRLRLQAVPPRKNAVGQMETLQEDSDTPGKFVWKVDPDLGQDRQIANRQDFFEHGTNALAALHGGDPSQITDEERATLQSHWDMAQHAASVHNTDSRNQTSSDNNKRTNSTRLGIHNTPGAGGSGGGGGKISAGDKQELQNLKIEEGNIGKQLKGNGTYTVGDDGKPIILGTKAHQSLMATKQKRLNDIQARRQAITSKYQNGGAPSTPAPNQNPFTQAPAASSNPFRQ
jgi:hypothetical protein